MYYYKNPKQQEFEKDLGKMGHAGNECSRPGPLFME